MNRIDRLNAILIQLQTKRVVRAQDIADRFSISLRTVYRDVRALEEAGVPLIGEAGQGYSLVEGYRLPPVMFNKEEAMSFITAEKLVEKLADSATAQSYQSAMFKIKAVLRTAEKDLLENIESHIAVVKTRRQLQSRSDLELIPLILNSIASKKALQLTYFAQYSQESTERDIEPVGVFYLENYWHLIAFCHMRNDYRDFRMDRIADLKTTGKDFVRVHPSLKSYLDKMFNDRALTEVAIRVKRRIWKHLEEQKYYNGFVSETELGEEVEMNFLSASLEGFARWYLMFGDSARIVRPEQLREKVRSLLLSVSASLNNPELSHSSV